MFNFNNVVVVASNNFRTTYSVVCDINFVPVLNDAGYPIIVQTYNVSKSGKTWGAAVDMGSKEIQFPSIGAVRAAAKKAADMGVDLKTSQDMYLAELEAAKATKSADKKSASPDIHTWMEIVESMGISKGKNSTNWLNPGYLREEIAKIIGAQLENKDFTLFAKIKESGFSTEKFVEQYRDYKNSGKNKKPAAKAAGIDDALEFLNNL